jgi:DNA replication protein DnaC
MKTIKEIYRLPNCKKCENTRSVEYIDALLGSRTKACECVNYRSKLSLLRKSRIPDNYIGFEFSDYVPNTTESESTNQQNEWMIEDLKVCVKKHKLLRDEGYDLLLVGGAASGKTMLGTVVLKTLILKYGYSGIFTTAEELLMMSLDKISFGQKNHVPEITFEMLYDVDFLFIDNFQMISRLDNLPQMVMVVVSDFIKRRKASKKPMILTSQWSIEQLLQQQGFVSEMLYTLQSFRLRGTYSVQQRGMQLSKLGLPERKNVQGKKLIPK